MQKLQVHRDESAKHCETIVALESRTYEYLRVRQYSRALEVETRNKGEATVSQKHHERFENPIIVGRIIAMNVVNSVATQRLLQVLNSQAESN